MRILLFAEQCTPITGEEKRQDAVVSCKNHESISRIDLNFPTSGKPTSRVIVKRRDETT
jgi:hypothetical protein